MSYIDVYEFKILDPSSAERKLGSTIRYFLIIAVLKTEIKHDNDIVPMANKIVPFYYSV